MFKAYKKFCQLALQSEGRASRSDYWWVFLVHFIIRMIFFSFNVFFVALEVLGQTGNAIINMTNTEVQELTMAIVSHPTASMRMISILSSIFTLLIMIPLTTLTARRLRDAAHPVSLAYPLPAIYLVDVAVQFIKLPGLIMLANIFEIYLLMVILLCLRRTMDLTNERTL